MGKSGHIEVDRRACEALSRFFDRTQWSPVDNVKPGDAVMDKPFAEWLNAADDGTDEPCGEYELRQRKLGVMTFFGYLASKGCHPASMLRWLVCVGRALHAAPFAALTMHEAAMLMDETPAAHSYRCKVLSGEIRLHGMTGRILGDRLPGQKSAQASASYKACRKGNCNRKGGKKEEARRARAAAHGTNGQKISAEQSASKPKTRKD